MSDVLIKCSPDDVVRVVNVILHAMESDNGNTASGFLALVALTVDSACTMGISKSHMLDHMSDLYDSFQKKKQS